MTAHSVVRNIEVVQMEPRQSRNTALLIEKNTVVYKKCCTVRKVAHCLFVFTLALAFSLLVVVGIWFFIEVIIKEQSGRHGGHGYKFTKSRAGEFLVCGRRAWAFSPGSGHNLYL